MKAEELKGTLWKLTSAIGMVIRVYRHGLQPNDADIRALEAIWSELDAHRLEMEAAETQPAPTGSTREKPWNPYEVSRRMDDIETRLDEMPASFRKALTAQFYDQSVRLDRVEKRLGEIERKHDDLSRYYETHMKNCHAGWRR